MAQETIEIVLIEPVIVDGKPRPRGAKVAVSLATGLYLINAGRAVKAETVKHETDPAAGKSEKATGQAQRGSK